jgi:hypothetical protein
MMNDENEMNEAAGEDRAECVMIDIETLGTRPGSVVFAVGVVPFGRGGVEAGEKYLLPVEPQVDAGMRIDPLTLAWWLECEDNQKGSMRDLRRALTLPPLEYGPTLDGLVYDLAGMIGEKTEVWACGPDFDLRLLESLFVEAGLDLPWHYGQCRCFRTWRKTVGAPKPLNGHDALQDARNQAEIVWAWWRSQADAEAAHVEPDRPHLPMPKAEFVEFPKEGGGA